MKLTYSPCVAQLEVRVQSDPDAIPKRYIAQYRARPILGMELRIVVRLGRCGTALEASPARFGLMRRQDCQNLFALSPTFLVTRPLISRFLKVAYGVPTDKIFIHVHSG